jgi:hypothetical protein
MKFADGSELETDIILFSAGFAHVMNLRAKWFAIGERGGIKLMIIAKPQMKIFMRLVNVRFGTIKFMV